MGDVDVRAEAASNRAIPRTAGSKSLFGGGLAAICFFLPWMQVSCMGQVKSFSGQELANESGILWLVFFSALAIIAAVMHLRSAVSAGTGRPVILMAVVVGLGILILKFLQLRAGIDTPDGRISAQMLNLSWQLGFYGTLTGFLVAGYDALTMQAPGQHLHVALGSFAQQASASPRVTDPFAPRDGPASDQHRPTPQTPHAAHAAHAAHEQLAEVAAAATKSIEHAAATTAASARNAGAWAGTHRLAIAGGLAAIVTAASAFAVLRPKPQKDGTAVGTAFAECQSGYSTEASGVHRAILTRIERQPPSTRAALRAEIEQRLKPARNLYESCMEAANKTYGELASRWSSSPQQVTEFDAAFAAARSGTPLSVSYAGFRDEISEALPTFSQIQAALDKIRPELPNQQRILADLLGRQVDGWRFAFLSEFRETKIEAARPEGDSLELRLRLAMDDAYTRAPYLAVVLVRYRLNDDVWDFSSVRPLLVTNQPDVDYSINGEFFPVGRWRMSDHYATFTPDGRWTGEWDSGQSASGDWRIVNGHLVRTVNGSAWQTGRIVAFSAQEITLDAGWGRTVRAERASKSVN